VNDAGLALERCAVFVTDLLREQRKAAPIWLPASVICVQSLSA
jgi:hypothetical protein